MSLQQDDQREIFPVKFMNGAGGKSTNSIVAEHVGTRTLNPDGSPAGASAALAALPEPTSEELTALEAAGGPEAPITVTAGDPALDLASAEGNSKGAPAKA